MQANLCLTIYLDRFNWKGFKIFSIFYPWTVAYVSYLVKFLRGSTFLKPIIALFDLQPSLTYESKWTLWRQRGQSQRRRWREGCEGWGRRRHRVTRGRRRRFERRLSTLRWCRRWPTSARQCRWGASGFDRVSVTSGKSKIRCILIPRLIGQGGEQLH